MTELIRLENRGVIEVKGADARDFLQGIITNDIAGADEGRAIYAGLLTPQGKLLFDFFLFAEGTRYLIDVDSVLAGDLLKRLLFYRLRAAVEIQELKQAFICVDLAGQTKATDYPLSYQDPRLKEAGRRLFFLESENASCEVAPEKWQAHRLALGLPEGGLDYHYGDCFPHDIAMDQLNGIGFSKGCYVGQEVVSRMRHRGTARKRPMIICAEQELTRSDIRIEIDGAKIGQIGSVYGKRALAEIRLDRAEKAMNEGKSFTIAGEKIQILRPFWADYGKEFDMAGKNC